MPYRDEHSWHSCAREPKAFVERTWLEADFSSPPVNYGGINKCPSVSPVVRPLATRARPGPAGRAGGPQSPLINGAFNDNYTRARADKGLFGKRTMPWSYARLVSHTSFEHSTDIRLRCDRRLKETDPIPPGFSSSFIAMSLGQL